MNIKGKLTEIFEAKQVSDKFRKREFVVEYAENSQFPQYIKFELTQNNCELIDSFKKGDFVDVHFDLRGKPWTNKNGEVMYFTSLTAWKLLKTDGEEDGNIPEGHDINDIPPDDLPF